MIVETTTKYPEALNVALELTTMIIKKIDYDPNAGASRDLLHNPENYILNVFERCLHVVNGGHVSTCFDAQKDNSMH